MTDPLPETPIQNHGLVGNMRSAALVSLDGDIDFFCYPEFDSPTVFAAILDREKGGSFSIRPEGDGFTLDQLYVPDTNVLLTRFLFDDALAEVSDFMPVGDGAAHVLMREVEVIRGEVRFSVRCSPRFDYARAKHTTERVDKTRVAFHPLTGNAVPMELRASIPLEAKDDGAFATFTLKKGERAAFVFGEPKELANDADLVLAVQSRRHAACVFWRQWARKSSYGGRWQELVTRSSLLLKLLTSERHGSLIAAPTFGLPEEMGGVRNWDYRYTWLRDASFSLYALTRLGYVDESRHFNQWIKGRLIPESEGRGPLQTMYGVDGRTDLTEEELTNLGGHRGSKPVRIGNAAYRQLQLDIYGELFDAVYLSSKYGDGIPYEAWERMKKGLRWLSEHWRDPDEGIWEIRDERKEFLHSRVMCWVAFDRALRLAGKRSLAGPLDWIEEARDAVVRDVHENFWDAELGSFVQYKGAKTVDASVLLMPLMRFISPADPRWLSTLAVIERDLTVDALVKRYHTSSGVDGLEGSEGSFVACSFWFVEALARSGKVDRAHELFAKLVTYANHLGLYSEELSHRAQHLGNFPQALTHLALISAATYLDRRLSHDKQEPWS